VENALFKKTCNIDKTDRINRAIIGVFLFLGAYFGLGLHFFMAVGIILLIEGLIGWCSIPYLIKRFKKH
tara:strand:- start:2015 stop:2221 length:207 start_codon:yes stop_codon:yes gene_type:complete